jgi:hypothetical protein
VDAPTKSSWTTEVLGQTRRARGGARGRAAVCRSGSRRQQSGGVARAPAKGEGEESAGRRVVALHGTGEGGGGGEWWRGNRAAAARVPIGGNRAA